MTTVQCGHCSHVWNTTYQSHCKCPQCKASQSVQDMRARYIATASGAAPATPVRVQPIPPQKIFSDAFAEVDKAPSKPRDTSAGVPIADQHDIIKAHMERIKREREEAKAWAAKRAQQ